jgi:lysophospholipase L1-like esterase
MKFVKETLQKKANPILFSSIARRNFNEQGVLIDTHGDYTMEARLVAKEMSIPFIDLQYLTEKLEESYGVEGSKKLHLHYEAGEISYYPEGKEDNTHLSELGATEIAKLVMQQIELLNIHLKTKVHNRNN